MDNYTRLLETLTDKEFELPISWCTADYFPDYVDNRIAMWIDHYKINIKTLLSKLSPGTVEGEEDLTERLERLKQSIKKTFSQYYEGDILGATSTFNSMLDDTQYRVVYTRANIPVDTIFYKGRVSDNELSLRSEMFHVPFQLRHEVRTNRYSIPGLPALYLGNSTFVCWRELNSNSFRKIYFSRFRNVKDLNVIRLFRFNDLVQELKYKTEKDAIPWLWRHILLFPIAIASTICVQHRDANFKPEYIIPQLLLQYVAENKELDGIMYPSTRVDYSKIENVPAYNFIFPIKKSSKKGFCETLISNFELTEPTSLELEELLFNSDQAMLFSSSPKSSTASLPRIITYLEGYPRGYDFTSFGLIEKRLSSRPLKIVN